MLSFLFKSLKLCLTAFIPVSSFAFFSNIEKNDNYIEKNSSEEIKPLKFIPFDEFCDKNYFNVKKTNNNFVLEGFNLDKKTEIKESIDANGYNAFFIPDYVTSIVGPNESISIGAFQYAFSNDETKAEYVSNKITSIIFESDSICSSLGKYCFSHCDSVDFVGLSNSITSLGDHCFADCLSLSTVLLSKNLKTIPWDCFGCYSTETPINSLSINIPEGVETIERAAFEARSIDSITFPSTLKTIGDTAFKNSTVSSMSFLNIDSTKISSMSFSSTWASNIKPSDTETNKIMVFLPKGMVNSYTAVSRFIFDNQQINDGLIYTTGMCDSIFKLDVDKYEVKSNLNFNLIPNQQIYEEYMDTTASYNFSCESSDPTVVSPNLKNDDILQGKLEIWLKKSGFSKITISEICNKVHSSFIFLNSLVQTNLTYNSLIFKDVQFNSYTLKTTDSPITTNTLNNNVYDAHDIQILDNIKFSIVDGSQKPYTLPSWITLDQTTGSLKISPNNKSETILDIKIMVEQSTTGLVGYSDKFSIIIQNISPSYLIINNNFTTINANVGDTVTTPSLTDKIITDIGTKITTGVAFLINGSLPIGLSFDETTGAISGKIDPNATSSYDLSITASATIDDSKTISGTSNGFSIVISPLPPKPTKLIIDYDFLTIISAPGETVSTPSLINYVVTDTGQRITNDVTFVMDDNLPDGLSFDSSVGQITGVLTENSQSSYDLSISVSARVDSEQLYGKSSLFSIIVKPSPTEPTKLLINENIPTIYVEPNQAVRTSSLKESVTTDTGIPITEGLTFSCNNLPTGFLLDETTGVISCYSVPDDTEDVIDLQIHVSANVGSIILEGYSNYFSIVIHSDIQPTKLIIDYDFQTIHVDEGQSVSTPNLTNSIVTDYWSPVTSSLIFSCDSVLPLGLSLDSRTGEIFGSIQADATSCTNIRIKVQSTIGQKTLYGYSNSFSIIINQISPTPDRLLFTANMYDVSTFVGKAVSIDRDLQNNIITNTGTKINPQEHALTFALIGKLPLGLSFDQTTGKITGKVQIGATSSNKLTITASANYDGINLTGESNSFYINVNGTPVSPSSLEIDYNMETYFVNTNDQFATPSLIQYVRTNLYDKVSENLFFSVASELPKGLEIDETNGSIYGKITEQTNTPKYFELEICVQTTLDGKILQGKTNSFTIVLNKDKVKKSDTTSIILASTLAPLCFATITSTAALTVKIKRKK